MREGKERRKGEKEMRAAHRNIKVKSAHRNERTWTKKH
jgi:hypothetical protein